MRYAAPVVFAAFLGGCASFGWGRDDNERAPFSPRPPTETAIHDAAGGEIGRAHFTAAPYGVLIRLEFSSGALPPGWHGVHLHEVGDCSDAGMGFHASRAHVGHDDAVQHGLMNPAGPEPGDLPNLFAPETGAFGAELFSPWSTLGPLANQGRAPLLDADGSALIIHAGADDHLSQPIGGAGARIACAQLTP